MQVREMIAAYGGKMETIEDDEEEEENYEGVRVARADVVIDATSEYCRNLGAFAHTSHILGKGYGTRWEGDCVGDIA